MSIRLLLPVCLYFISASYTVAGQRDVDSCHLHTISFRGGEAITAPNEIITTVNSSSDIPCLNTSNVTHSNSTPERQQNHTYGLFQVGDGHEEDPDSIPGRYLRMQSGNRAKAKKALASTLKWRQENNMDSILTRPHPNYDICKTALPHFFLGRDNTGHVVFVQRPGFYEPALATGLTDDDMILHYAAVLEYLWNVVEPRPDETMTSIIDMKHVNLKKTRKMLGFLQRFIRTIDAHYPSRAHITLVINCPTWFGAFYRLIAPFMRASTRKKIEVMSPGKKQEGVLRGFLGEDGIPDGLLAGEQIPTSGLAMEEEFRGFILARLEEGGTEMNDVPVLEEMTA